MQEEALSFFVHPRVVSLKISVLGRFVKCLNSEEICISKESHTRKNPCEEEEAVDNDTVQKRVRLKCLEKYLSFLIHVGKLNESQNR